MTPRAECGAPRFAPAAAERPLTATRRRLHRFSLPPWHSTHHHPPRHKMSKNDPATYSSLKDLKQSSRTWWGGKKNSTPTPTAEPESYAPPPPPPSSSSTFTQKSRYIPPSQREPGQGMFVPVPTAAEREREREREAKRQQSWGEWANENATWASNSVSESYNSTFNAENRDKVGWA